MSGFRDTFVTRYYAMTGDISATSTVMNHSSIEVTASYYLQEMPQRLIKRKIHGGISAIRKCRRFSLNALIYSNPDYFNADYSNADI